MNTQSALIKILQHAGITLNGNSPGDIQVHNEKLFAHVLKEGSLGLGESYMEGWWDCSALDVFFAKLGKIQFEKYLKKNIFLLAKIFFTHLINFQTQKRAFEVGKKHYDVGNDLFKCMLDSRLIYSCGYWKQAATLEDAQIAKLELICQKLNLQPGMRLLDIGCGWGGFAKYAAEKYKVNVVGITISRQQYAYATQLCQNLPIEIRFQDYRDIREKFDRVVSVGMFEHVGYLNYSTYLRVIHDCLPEHGILLLHTIGSNISVREADPWINQYIFPNGMLPSIAQLGNASEGLFIMEDWHNFGADYDKTLMAWQHNFVTNWDLLKMHYDQRFYRMWNYYLLLCAGMFRARQMQLWQVVFSKNGIPGGYQAPR